MEKPRIAVLIPAMNEAHRISNVINSAKKFVDDIIVCDDGSTDKTAEIARSLGARVIKHSKNKGYGAAIQSLFKEAIVNDYDFVITLDADGQHDPADIPKLVNEMVLDQCDILIGSRFIAEDESDTPVWRSKGIQLINSFVENGVNKITDSQSGFRAYNKKAYGSLTLTEDGMGLSTEILIKAHKLNLRICETPIKIKYYEDSSTHNPITHGIDVILSTLKFLSINKPLQFYGVPGLLSGIISLFFWGWTFQAFATTKVIITNVTLIAIVTTLVGMMFLTTAIILWVLTSLIQENIKYNSK